MPGTNQRLSWIDTSKVIGIILVILGHGELVSDSMRVFIYSFHMPLFFIISGILDKGIGFNKHLASKYFYRLIVPFVTISFITIALEVFIGNRSITWISNSVVGMGLGNGYSYMGYVPPNGPLWFLVALFFTKLLFSVTIKLRKLQQGSLIILLFLLFFYLRNFNTDLPFSLDCALISYPFYIFGYKIKNMITKVSLKGSICSVIIMSPLTILLILKNGKVDINTCNYGYSFLLFIIVGILGSTCILLISRIFNVKRSNKLIKSISSSTILILGFHLYFVSIISKVLSLFKNDTFIHILVVTIGVVLLCLLFFSYCMPFVESYVPFLVGQKKKK